MRVPPARGNAAAPPVRDNGLPSSPQDHGALGGRGMPEPPPPPTRTHTPEHTPRSPRETHLRLLSAASAQAAACRWTAVWLLCLPRSSFVRTRPRRVYDGRFSIQPRCRSWNGRRPSASPCQCRGSGEENLHSSSKQLGAGPRPAWTAGRMPGPDLSPQPGTGVRRPGSHSTGGDCPGRRPSIAGPAPRPGEPTEPPGSCCGPRAGRESAGDPSPPAPPAWP